MVVEQTDDRVLLWSPRFDMGIYGCSPLIINPKKGKNTKIGFQGHFAPDYVGRIEKDYDGISPWSGFH